MRNLSLFTAALMLVCCGATPALYDTQGQYASAEPLYKRSLAIKEKALGPDHPSMAASLNNLPRSSIQRSLLRRAMPGGGVNGSRPTISIASSRG
jgi:hypothetical protein